MDLVRYLRVAALVACVRPAAAATVEVLQLDGTRPIDVVAAGDGIVLKIAKDPPSDADLIWSGGSAPYGVARGAARDGSDLASIASGVSGTSYIDLGALDAPGTLAVYRVTSSPAPRLSELQAAIFTPSCAKSGCHAGGFPAAGLNLSAGRTHADTVGIPSGEQPAVLRIDPGNPAGSYLVRKIEGDPTIDGARMPRDGPPYLSAAQIADIRAWIAGGAPDN